MMERTIHLPDDLAKELEVYLRENPKDSSRLLNLVGIFPEDAPSGLSTDKDLHH